jgi:hypothetical protein
MNAYQVTRGLVASGRGDWAAAADAHGRAALVDDLPQSWLGLAQARLELGAPVDQVAEPLQHALRSGSQQPAVLYAAASLFDRIGMTDEADEAYATVLASLPGLAADPALTDDAATAPRMAGIVERAAALSPAGAWQLALMSGDAEAARLLAREPGAAPTWAPTVVEAWLGDRQAADELYAMADADPFGETILGWASRIAARDSDQDRADRYSRLATFASFEGAGRPAQEVRVEPTAWLEDVPAGALTWYAGQWMYRRPSAFDLIPPGLPRLVFVDDEAG